MSDDPRLISSRRAAELLGVQPATLYAYVSRGQLRSKPGADSRSRLYDRDEVLALREARASLRDPSRISREALDWGLPVLDSEITLIEGGRLHYRGHDVAVLARERRLEEVAALIWLDDFDAARDLFAAGAAELPASWWKVLGTLADAHPGDAMQMTLRLAAGEALEGHNLRPEPVIRCGSRLLRRMIAGAAGDRGRERGGILAPLEKAWLGETGGEKAGLLDAALILCVDHELNVSSFTARCVASAASSPYEVVAAGLAALRGFRHGGHTERVAALLSELGVSGGASDLPDSRTIRRRLAGRLQRGERIPGFGHPLYPDGDPRYVLLAERLEEAYPRSPILAAVRRVVSEGEQLLEERPTIDFGLVMLSTQLGLGPRGAWTVFALGRTVGWIGHALEEYGRRRLIRPRARYSGRLPTDPATPGVA